LKHQTQPPRERPHFVFLPSIVKIEEQIICMIIDYHKRGKKKSKHVLDVGIFFYNFNNKKDFSKELQN
jgi:hypothetical protein